MTEFTPDPGGARPRRGHPGRGQFLAGCILVLIGLLFLVDQTFIADDLLDIRRLWPLILIAIGVAKISTPRADGQPTGGYMLTMVGVIFLMHTLHYWSIRTSWPLFVVAAGLNILFGAIAQARLPRGNSHVS